MTAEQIAMLTSILKLTETATSWPVLSLLFLMIIGPWVMALMIAHGNEKRFEAVVEMYKSNASLCKDYEKLATDLKDVVMINTQTFSELAEAIKHNQFCPIVRKEGGMG